ncbi:MAG: glycosyltransferase family 2 protein [Acidobacteria bacterium]|nr:MAG: glycosyltransferase family 2 protein [Acidobacteriota bacterium]
MGGVVYHYAGYPLLLFIVSTLSQAKSDLLYLLGRSNRRCEPVMRELPRVALLISAYNEESVIQAKVKNCFEIDYPVDRLEMFFGLDAPTDSTHELLAHIACNRVNVVEFITRRGKLAVLCDLAQRTSAEILVFTDANTMLAPNCIRNFVRHFSDPQVGSVSGEEIRTVGPGTDPAAESVYWRYESAMKILESRLNCSLGGNGAALAIRRSLFRPTKQSIVEDFQIPLEIRFKGFRVVYDPEVIAVEEITPNYAAQFARRVRIGAGNYQTLFRNLDYLNPLQGLLAFCFFSHRVLRWLVPLFLVTALVCSVVMARDPEFGLLAVLQCAFYLMAVAGYYRKKGGRPAGLFSVPLYFCSMNLALLLGFHAYLTGRQSVVWNATPRRFDSRTQQESLLNRPVDLEASSSALQRPAA